MHVTSRAVRYGINLEICFLTGTYALMIKQQEPCSGKGGSSTGGNNKGQLQCDDPAKWEEIHTDYIYTQDVKHP